MVDKFYESISEQFLPTLNTSVYKSFCLSIPTVLSLKRPGDCHSHLLPVPLQEFFLPQCLWHQTTDRCEPLYSFEKIHKKRLTPDIYMQMFPFLPYTEILWKNTELGLIRFSMYSSTVLSSYLSFSFISFIFSVHLNRNATGCFVPHKHKKTGAHWDL